MGGGVALTYALQGSHRDKLAGTIVWSPMLQLADKPFALLVSAGRLGSKLFPNRQMVQKLPPAYMSRDQSVCDEFANDPVCLLSFMYYYLGRDAYERISVKP